jgi:ABC-type transport system involved in multi-copper enzyme maturation permease subunit
VDTHPWVWVVIVGTVLPALAGVFVGAPLVAREIESGTHLVAWSQSVTRRRWFLARVGLVAAGAAAGAALLAAIAQGWFAMQRGAGGSGFGIPSIWVGFEIGPAMVIAYTLFAIALGVAMGAAIRRTVPAMAAALAGFIVVRVCVAGLARPIYLTPLTDRTNIDTAPDQIFTSSSGWQFGPMSFVNAAGHPVVAPGQSFCYSISPPVTPGCLQGPIYILQSYQPASRFWLFQGIEAAIFLVLALALFALAYRLVMRIR